MRHAVFSLSWLVAICGAFESATAADPAQYDLMRYSQSEARGQDADCDDDCFVCDPRYDWELSDGPADINTFFAVPQYESYFQAEALWLSRIHQVDQVVAVTLPPLSQPVLNSNDASLTSNFRLGTQLTFGRRLDAVSALELTFFGFNTWHNSAQVEGGGNLSLPGTLPLFTQDYIFANQIRIDYDSSIYNVEGNYTQTIAGLKFLSGFRYVRLNESFDINSTVLLQNGATSSSDYLVRAKNNLIGGQAGLGFDAQWDCLTIDLLGKFGVYGNVAEQNTLLKDFNNTLVLRNSQDHITSVALLGEAVFNGTYRVCDWLAIRGGYRFIWMTNVALAPSQLDFNNAPNAGQSVDAQGYLYLHGVNIGAEISW
jgi:hypothetical protein